MLLTDRSLDRSKAWAKPIDFFVRIGPRLIAIDNGLVPKFAYVFERDRSGAMRFRYRGGLPHGGRDELTGGAGFNGAVLLTSAYGHRGGRGYRLYRSEIGPAAITNATLVHTHLGWPVGDGASEPERIGPDLGGPWSGIAAAGDRVLLGAREKGILILDPDAPRTATFVDVAGRCDGLLLVGQAVIALVNQQDVDEEENGKPDSRIVAFRWDGARRALERIRAETLAVNLPRIAR